MRAKRRVAVALLLGSALTAGVAMAGVGASYGQDASVGNAGNATASSGGNSGTGNSSRNAAVATGVQQLPAPTLLGTLLGLVQNVAGVSNTSNGSSNITTGAGTATGSTSDTSVGQASSGGGGPTVIGTIFGPVFVPDQGQSATVTNTGGANASTGGNTSTGNNSQNTATITQTVSGGLVNIGINMGNAINNSNGTSNITTGPATALGNDAGTSVHQVEAGGRGGAGGGAVFRGPGGIGGPVGPGGARGFRGPGGIGGGDPCDTGFFGSGFFGSGGQDVSVRNSGTASASTGQNTGVGNSSTNVATVNQIISNGLVSVANNTANATNTSDGTANITTGAATATGNVADTTVGQQCGVPVRFAGPPSITPAFARAAAQQPRPPRQLAVTGVDPFITGFIAFVLLFGGLMLLVWDRVEALPVVGRRTA